MATVKIWVKLDKEATNTAKVKLESRDKEASSGDKIKWHKHDNDDDFDIEDLQPQGAESVFKDVESGDLKNHLRCEFEPGSADPDTEFEYTLSVKSDGVTYDTTDPSVQAEDGKPVIRN